MAINDELVSLRHEKKRHISKGAYLVAGVGRRGNHARLVKRLHGDLVGRMAIEMAHEIRNPLTVIKGYLQLQEKRSTCSMGESLDIIFQELHQIEVLVTSIISLANHNANKKNGRS